MKDARMFNFLIKFGLFTLTLVIGTVIALRLSETEGLANIELSEVPVETMTIAYEGNALYAKLAGGERAAGFYRSVDNGRTWQSLGPEPASGITVLTPHGSQSDVLYAGGVGGPIETAKNLWRSEDGGQTWTKFNLNLPANPQRIMPDITALVVDPARPDLLYVGTAGHGVYRLDEDELGYEAVGDISLHDAYVTNLVVGPESQLYALTTEGLFTVEDDVWRQLKTPDAVVSFATAAGKQPLLYVGSASTGVYRSGDNGRTWLRVSNGLEQIPGAALRVTALAVDEQNPQQLAVATAYGVGSRFAPGHLYHSNSGGQSWTKVADLQSEVTDLTFNKGVIHASTATGLQQYGKIDEQTFAPISTPPVIEVGSPASGWSSMQVLVVVLTIGLAVLILLYPMRWLESGRRPA